MGCGNSKQVEDPRRAKQAEKRKKSQERLRPDDPDKQTQLTSSFENEASTWPSRPPWHIKGKYTQGINILLASPEPLRDLYFTVVARNEAKYTVTIGYGKETKFDASALRLTIACSTVSMNHCKLHFTKTKKSATVDIEDSESLNGTFILGRPAPRSNRRPMLEMEVRGQPHTLESVEYIRLGSACVIALDSTNIYWDDEDDDEPEAEEEAGEEDLVPGMLDNGWYFPMPCPPKLAEVTQKKRDVPDQVARSNSKEAARV